jgi:hypothetical protein
MARELLIAVSLFLIGLLFIGAGGRAADGTWRTLVYALVGAGFVIGGVVFFLSAVGT